jgi:hypothetical protein
VLRSRAPIAGLAPALATVFAVAEGKQKRITQRVTLDVYLSAPGGKPRKTHSGELRRLGKLGFRETDRRLATREDHLKVTLEREIERYPGVPTPAVAPYIR